MNRNTHIPAGLIETRDLPARKSGLKEYYSFASGFLLLVRFIVSIHTQASRRKKCFLSKVLLQNRKIRFCQPET
jgi:hypothetical protein